MTPLLPFFAGLAAGAAAVSALRSERARDALSAAGDRLRTVASDAENSARAAARSGLALLHRAPVAPESQAPAEVAPEAAPARKPAAPKRAPKAAKPRRAARKTAPTTNKA